jgi:nucleoside-diphosphate-sugar epimerase
MTRVFVTGAVGRLGREVVRQFVDAGDEVVGADRVSVDGVLPDGVRLVVVDLRDLGQVAQAIRDCDALVHLAAIPAPYGRPDDVIFRNNVLATFNALQGASLAGIRSVALASSGSIYGTAWSPDYLAHPGAPVREDTELANHDVYGLGKEVDEHVARMFCRRDGMSIACLRFHWIAHPDEQRAAARALAEPDADLHGSGRGLWGYVDVRDAASACVQAITTGVERPYGFAALNITAADTLSRVPTEDLLRQHSPGTRLLAPIEGTSTAFDLSAAEKTIGWRPRHSWRDA